MMEDGCGRLFYYGINLAVVALDSLHQRLHYTLRGMQVSKVDEE